MHYNTTIQKRQYNYKKDNIIIKKDNIITEKNIYWYYNLRKYSFNICGEELKV